MTAQNTERSSRPNALEALAGLDQEAMDALPQAVYVCASDGRLIRFNKKAVGLWGRTPKAEDPAERFCGSFRLHRTNGAPLPHDQCPMATTLQTGRSFMNEEVVVEQPGGRHLTVLVNIAALKDEQGRVNGAVNCFQDISERKRAEEQQRRLTKELLFASQSVADSERRLREMIDALPAAIYTTDAEGRITHFNTAAVALSGRTPQLGTDRWCVTWKLYHPDGTPMPQDQCPMAVALREGRAVRGEEAIAERPDGTRVWFTPYPTPLRDASGRIAGAINMLVDMTESREAERQLRLVVSELNHRVKNTFAVVQSMARQMFANEAPAHVCAAFEGRLAALSRAQGLLIERQWDAADLMDIVREMARNDERITIQGSPVRLAPTLAINLAMALHELCTNAAKYGALSVEGGRVSIAWDIADDPQRRLLLQWTEANGPRVASPTRSGFGTQLIEAAIGSAAGSSVQQDFKPEGLVCRIEAPLGAL